MSLNSEKKLVLVAAWGFVLTGVVLVSQTLADDSKTTNAPHGKCEIRVEVRGDVPFLGKIPLVKYFVQQAEAKECQAEDQEFERIGVDFDALPGHIVTCLPDGKCQVICTQNECGICDAEETCPATKDVLITKGTCVVSQCNACQDLDVCTAGKEATCELECAELPRVCQEGHVHWTTDQLAQVRLENVTLQAAQEAQRSILQARSEMFETLLELSTENARLGAQVDFLNERSRMREEMVELMSEIGRLKATAQLAEERNSLQKKSLEVALENERLKLRIAELEKHQDGSAKVARTAKKPRTARKTTELK